MTKNLLEKIKAQQWFYEFSLPDGSKTDSYLPEVARKIHLTREKALRTYLQQHDFKSSTAFDISCHEGYFSVVLSDYFKAVKGVDKNIESLNKARQITELFGKTTITFENTSMELLGQGSAADFVLCYGLLYHVENPVEVVRKLAALTKKSLCIETQILPYELEGPIEDGSYLWQRSLHGLFGLCVDYSARPEGGLTDLALVPSKAGLAFLLKQFGFQKIDFYVPAPDDYEQFVRGHRVIVCAEK